MSGPAVPITGLQFANRECNSAAEQVKYFPSSWVFILLIDFIWLVGLRPQVEGEYPADIFSYFLADWCLSIYLSLSVMEIYVRISSSSCFSV